MSSNSTIRSIPKIVWQEYSIIIVTIFIFAVAGIIAPRFIQPANLLLILRQSAIIGVIAMGMTYVIITGGIDLSAGHVVASSGAVLMLLQSNPNVPLGVAILACFAVATAIGLLNGVVITQFRVPPFIVTLAIGIMARSAALYLTGGTSITGDRGDTIFRGIGTGTLFDIIPIRIPAVETVLTLIPIPLLIWLFLALILGAILKYTKYGTNVFAVGGNEIASKYSGINVNRTKIIAYGLTGLCAGLSAILDLSRTVTIAVPNAGQMYEFEAITAVVIGGTLLSGGRGKILNTFFGVVIIVAVPNLMVMLGISVFLSGFIKGALILTAVLLQRREKANV